MKTHGLSLSQKIYMNLLRLTNTRTTNGTTIIATLHIAILYAIHIFKYIWLYVFSHTLVSIFRFILLFHGARIAVTNCERVTSFLSELISFKREREKPSAEHQ